MRWKALGHRDRERAIAEAHEVAARLQRGEELMEVGKTVLVQLFLAYEKHRTPRKSLSERRADHRRIELCTRFLGADQAVEAITLEQWECFIDARSSGAIDGRGRTLEIREREWEDKRCDAVAEGRPFLEPRPKVRPVRARSVESDCQWLRLAVGWGTKWRDRAGRYLLADNPLRGYPVPKERNPRRPVASTDRLEALLSVAGQVGDLTDLLAVAAGSGRRLSAILNLRFDDVDLKSSKVAPYGSIRWRAGHDKAGREAVVPMSPDVRGAVDRIREKRPGIGAAWLFPSPKDSSKADPARCC